MPSLLFILSVLSAGILAVFYQLQVAPIIKTLGIFATINTENLPERCLTFKELMGCEKLVLHFDTGLAYMACSTIDQRHRWMNPRKGYTIPRAGSNFLAIFNPATNKSFHVALEGLDTSRTIAYHGLDVVVSDTNKNELFIYLIHHQEPIGWDVGVDGYDSCVEIFKTTVGSNVARHLHTINGPVVQTPNDLVGASDGKSFYFTNDGKKTTKAGSLFTDIKQMIHPTSTVGYCHVEDGCMIALSNVLNPNGITQAPNGTIFVGCAVMGGVQVMEKQTDKTLIVVDVIPTDTLLDNLSLDEDGFIWAAGFPKPLDAGHTLKNMSHPCPHISWKLGIDTGPESSYGKRYISDKVLQDDGSLLSFITTVAYDSRRERLFLHGLASHWLTVCELPKTN